MSVVITDEAVLRRLVAEELERVLRPVLDMLAHQGGAPGAHGGDTLMTRAEVAQTMRVDARTLRRLVLEGAIPPPIRIGERTQRWRRSTIQAFLKRKEEALTSGRR